MNLKKIPDDICYLILSYIEEPCYNCGIFINYKDLLQDSKKYKIGYNKIENIYQDTTRKIKIKSWFEEEYNEWFGKYYIILCKNCSKVKCSLCRLQKSYIDPCEDCTLKIQKNFELVENNIEDAHTLFD